MTVRPSQHLRVDECAACERKDRQLAAMRVDKDNLEVDLAVKRREITRLKNQLADKLRSDPLFPVAERIFEFWRERCQPNARTFSDDRLKAVLARLKDRDPNDPEKPAYDPRYICEAILGAKFAAYVDPKGKRHQDLELICRSGRKLEDFNERYQRHKAKEKR